MPASESGNAGDQDAHYAPSLFLATNFTNFLFLRVNS